MANRIAATTITATAVKVFRFLHSDFKTIPFSKTAVQKGAVANSQQPRILSGFQQKLLFASRSAAFARVFGCSSVIFSVVVPKFQVAEMRGLLFLQRFGDVGIGFQVNAHLREVVIIGVVPTAVLQLFPAQIHFVVERRSSLLGLPWRRLPHGLGLRLYHRLGFFPLLGNRLRTGSRTGSGSAGTGCSS